MQDHMQVELASAALTITIQQQRPQTGLIHHSDRGLKYASHAYRKVLTGAGVMASMSRKADCSDNAPMERLLPYLENRAGPSSRLQTRAEASAISSPSSRASTTEPASIPRSDMSPRWKWS
ncbi:DDE-type integrase/transposase/recombinase [Bradyrhizobium sp. CCBAU 11357]|uniref:DDE-type integrase/transposase/recombinase n=1 Tax=Bradyrhizobium sp. CCBAU 11357 TaxID=1630808 RepID=UPI003FA4217E